ncbi:MAG TPA: hypothetical protein VGO47_13535, partial [Chlamydiales bacterium]|nr:hypothetical protein [Chlamydiales bacterium]
RAKVERLEGEVERLRTLVEDGVRERQRAKEESQVEMEDSTSLAQVGIDITYVTNPLDCENNMEAAIIQQASGLEDHNQQGHVDYHSEGEDYQPPDSLPGAESDPEFDGKSQPRAATRVKRFIHVRNFVFQLAKKDKEMSRTLSLHVLKLKCWNDALNGLPQEVTPQLVVVARIMTAGMTVRYEYMKLKNR